MDSILLDVFVYSEKIFEFLVHCSLIVNTMKQALFIILETSKR